MSSSSRQASRLLNFRPSESPVLCSSSLFIMGRSISKPPSVWPIFIKDGDICGTSASDDGNVVSVRSTNRSHWYHGSDLHNDVRTAFQSVFKYQNTKANPKISNFVHCTVLWLDGLTNACCRTTVSWLISKGFWGIHLHLKIRWPCDNIPSASQQLPVSRFAQTRALYNTTPAFARFLWRLASN